ncbi:MAG TPA: protein phosphatase 2C domain-containing protein [Casimicrobiaceae bacterium]
MQVDHHSIIGQGHVEQGMPCQDSAGSAIFADGRAFAAVADGCSSVRGRTEIGARQIIAAFHDLVRDDPRAPADPQLGERLLRRFHEYRVTANPLDYYTTLVALVATRRALEFYLCGDGTWAVAYDDGTIEVTTVEWYRNAPYYLAIRDSPDVDAMVRDIYAPLADGPVQESTIRFRPHADGIDIVTRQERWCPLHEFEYGKSWTVDRDAIPIRAAAVMTDGIGDVGYAPSFEIVAELLRVPPEPARDFARDQVVATARRHAARGEVPMDDLSLALVLMD